MVLIICLTGALVGFLLDTRILIGALGLVFALLYVGSYGKRGVTMYLKEQNLSLKILLNKLPFELLFGD